MSGKKIGCAVLGLVLAVVLVGAGVALVLRPSQPIPLPADKAGYVGTWLASGVVLIIHPDGKVDYARKQGAISTSVVGLPITRFDGNDFSVGTALVKTAFVVAKPPAQVDGRWKMTVNGIELTRNPTPDDHSDSTVNVGCAEAQGGFNCTVTHTGGVHALKACFQLQLACMNGTRAQDGACETVQIGGRATHKLPFTDFPGLQRCDRPKGMHVVLQSVTGAD